MAMMVSTMAESHRSRGRGKPTRVLLAPDSFKGTFSAPEVVAALAPPFERADHAVDSCPLADGGEGTADALRGALGGGRVEAEAHDPLGRPISSSFVLLRDGSAAVDTAAASGLSCWRRTERDPEAASTLGRASSSSRRRAARRGCSWASAGARPPTAGPGRWRRSPRRAGSAKREWSACVTFTPHGSRLPRRSGRRRAPTRPRSPGSRGGSTTSPEASARSPRSRDERAEQGASRERCGRPAGRSSRTVRRSSSRRWGSMSGSRARVSW